MHLAAPACHFPARLPGPGVSEVLLRHNASRGLAARRNRSLNSSFPSRRGAALLICLRSEREAGEEETQRRSAQARSPSASPVLPWSLSREHRYGELCACVRRAFTLLQLPTGVPGRAWASPREQESSADAVRVCVTAQRTLPAPRRAGAHTEPREGHARVRRVVAVPPGLLLRVLGELEVGTAAGNCRRLSFGGRKLSQPLKHIRKAQVKRSWPRRVFRASLLGS